MKYLRRSERKTREDRIMNKTIRESLKMGSEIYQLEKRNVKWYGFFKCGLGLEQVAPSLVRRT